MNLKIDSRRLPMLTAILGAAAAAARLGLYAAGTDHKGLLRSGHPLELLVWALTLAAAAVLGLTVPKLEGSRRHSVNFPESTVSAAGCIALAAGIFITVLTSRYDTGRMGMVRNLAGLLCVPGATAVAICRRRGKRPFVLFHCVICAYFALYAVGRYPVWSSHPQLQDSVFSLLGCLGLMIFAYHQTAFDAGMGSRRMLLASGLAAGFCCLAAVPKNDHWALYLAAGIWALTNLCVLTPPARRPVSGQEAPPAGQSQETKD